jgi:mono/diheme cytochrome c family protein
MNSGRFAQADTIIPGGAQGMDRYADAATAGADIFRANCESCHGSQGHGDGTAGAALDPKPKNLPELAATVGDDYLYWRVNTGKEGTAMVPWKGILTDDQIWQVVAYIRTLK